MKNKSVAILDIRSYEVTFFLGSKGVNNTFVFHGNHSEKYEGFSTEGFFDETSFRRAVVAAVTSVRQNFGGVIGEIYVGVPSPFVSLHTKGHTISFPTKRKPSAQDIDALYESGLNELMPEGNCIRRSNMYFTLGDNRKYFEASDLYGTPTQLVKGALCYYCVSDSFYEIVASVLGDLGFGFPKFLPTTLAEALYLLPPKRREGYAFLLDIGFLTTSLSVVYGNGLVHEESFDCGYGTILVALMSALSVDYATAEEILSSANVSGGAVINEEPWRSERTDASFPVEEINDIIKRGLDVICEKIEAFFLASRREKTALAFTASTLCLTGEGTGGIAGISEHIASRLNRLTEIVAPDLPYYDKPNFSSRMSLLDMAIKDRAKRGFWQRIFG